MNEVDGRLPGDAWVMLDPSVAFVTVLNKRQIQKRGTKTLLVALG